MYQRVKVASNGRLESVPVRRVNFAIDVALIIQLFGGEERRQANGLSRAKFRAIVLSTWMKSHG